MTRVCQCHRLPMIEAISDAPSDALDVPLCSVDLIPQRAWLIEDHDAIIGRANVWRGGSVRLPFVALGAQ